MSPVWKVIPESTFEEKLAAARAATDHAARLGVTSVQDVSAGNDVGVYQTLLDRGELKTRIYAVSPLPAWERLARTGVRAHFGNDMLRIGGLEGVCRWQSGFDDRILLRTLPGRPDYSRTRRRRNVSGGRNAERVRQADRAGLQVMIHAIGDRANDQILTLFAQVRVRMAHATAVFASSMHNTCGARTFRGSQAKK